MLSKLFMCHLSSNFYFFISLEISDSHKLGLIRNYLLIVLYQVSSFHADPISNIATFKYKLTSDWLKLLKSFWKQMNRLEQDFSDMNGFY